MTDCQTKGIDSTRSASRLRERGFFWKPIGHIVLAAFGNGDAVIKAPDEHRLLFGHFGVLAQLPGIMADLAGRLLVKSFAAVETSH